MTISRVPRLALIVSAAALAACVPPPNDVAEGVGFQDYQDFLARQAALRGGQVPGTNITQPNQPSEPEAEAPSEPDTPTVLLEEPEVRSVGLPPVYLPLPDR